MVWPTLGSRTAKEQNRTEQNRGKARHSTLYIYVLTHLPASNLAKLAASTEDERGEGNNMSEPNGKYQSFSR